MKIFLSWSGKRSRLLAEALRDWIPQVIQAIEPWMSPDIEKGARWNSEISAQLEECHVSIICLTAENLESPWLCFEAGALSKTKGAHTCTLLLDIRPADVQPPLGTFQHTLPDREDMRKLMHTINTSIAKQGEKPLPPEFLNTNFDRLWPDIESIIKSIVDIASSTTPLKRSDSEILAEILDVVRSQQRSDDNSSERMNKLIRVSRNLLTANDNIRKLEREIFSSDEENIQSLQDELDSAIENKDYLESELKLLEERPRKVSGWSNVVSVTTLPKAEDPKT